MDKQCKYQLELIEQDDTYTRCRIGGLDNIYFDPEVLSVESLFNGASGLIRSKSYPGYCYLCAVYHTPSSENFLEGYTVEFAPLYNKYGQKILLAYDKDIIMCSVRSGYKDYVTYKDIDAAITFWNNGTFEYFDK